MEEVTLAEWVRVGAMFAAFIASVWFGHLYARRTWETTPYGRNIMYVTTGLSTVALLGILHTLYTPGWIDIAEAAAWAGVTAAICHRRVLLARATRDARSAVKEEA